MTSLAWNGAIWALAFYLTKGPKAASAQTRLQFALALSLAATSAIVTGSAEEILRDPVIIERALRGSLSGIAGLIALPVLIKHGRVLERRRLPTYTWLITYGIVVTMSVLYSVAPLVTAGKAFEFGVGLLIVLGLVLTDRPMDGLRRSIDMIMVAFGLRVGIALIGFVALPGLFTASDGRTGFLVSRTLGSPYSGSNGLSFSAAVLAVVCAAKLLRSSDWLRRPWATSGLVIGLLGVVLSSGRQGVVILVASLTVLFAWYSPTLLVLFSVPVAALAVAFSEPLIQAFTRGQSDELFFSLSGRTRWWASAIEAWLEQPLMGFGYGAGGRFVALQRVGAGGVSSVHSGYLEILVGVGLLGMLPFLIVVGRIIASSFRMIRTRMDLAILIVPLLLHASISLGFGGWWSSPLALLALLAGVSDVRNAGPWSEADEIARADATSPSRARV